MKISKVFMKKVCKTKKNDTKYLEPIKKIFSSNIENKEYVQNHQLIWTKKKI